MEEKKQTWSEAQEWERSWHDTCANSYNEETKSFIYTHYMGLDKYAVNYYGQRGWDFGADNVLDIGCGPYSILLKSKSLLRVGVDPCKYPQWVKDRYEQCGIQFYNIKGEDLDIMFHHEVIFDKVLIYNCLQHVEDPAKIITNAKRLSKVIHIFEWIQGISPGHIQALTEENLNQWLEGEGKVVDINNGPCVGKCYYGIFKGDKF